LLNAGHDVDVYILDSGVRTTHRFFADKKIRHFRNKDPSPYVPNEPAVRNSSVPVDVQPKSLTLIRLILWDTERVYVEGILSNWTHL